MMRFALPLIALTVLTGFSSPAPTVVTIGLANYRFEPASIRLRAGQPYLLHFVNASGRGHNFVAPAFFAAAGTPRNKVEVAAGASADLVLTAPAAGRYKVSCTHFTHSMRGMTGEILVD